MSWSTAKYITWRKLL